MRPETRKKRHQAITDATYALLAENGYAGTSMLSIARAAKASNETLYRWYGDKRGLFETMVRDNAADAKALLEEAIDGQADPMAALEAVAPVLLNMLLGERAVALNRAAAGDASGELGAALSAGGREEIQPLIGDLIGRISARHASTPQDLGPWFVSLLIGDLQIRRAIGEMAEPDDAFVAARCDSALRAFRTLLEQSGSGREHP